VLQDCSNFLDHITRLSVFEIYLLAKFRQLGQEMVDYIRYYLICAQ